MTHSDSIAAAEQPGVSGPSDPHTVATLAHISDIHFGRIASPEIVAHLVEEVNVLGVDVVAVSGDLTMRARAGEFRQAAQMLADLKPPAIVVPGNHDVYPWWHPYARLRRPLRRYQRHVTEDLHPTFRKHGLAVLGINSAHGRTFRNGRIGSQQRGYIRAFFGALEEKVFKVLVVHHHLARLEALGKHDVAHKARQTMEAASHVGVDLVLCGHLHVSHIQPLDLVPERHRIVIASAGTATSDRRRGPLVDSNLYNLIRVSSESFEIEERVYHPGRSRFETHACQAFQRSFER